jgi:hypothetical protein
MAAYTWVGGLSDNWSTPGNWTASPPSVTIPGAADTVVINNAQPCRVTAASNCLTIDFTGFTSSFTISSGFTLTVSGTAVTLGAGMTFTPGTTGILSTANNQLNLAITFAGIVIPNLTLGKTNAGTQTITINGTTPTVRNLVTTGGTVTALTGSALTITNSIVINTTISSGPVMTFLGTVTMSGAGILNTGFTVPSGSTLIMGSNVNASGNITFASGSFLTPGTFTFTITSTCTLDSNEVTWYNFNTTSTGHVITLTSDLNISNNLTWSIQSFGIGIASATTKTITVQGSVTSTAAYSRTFNLNNIILNMTGRGTFAVASITPSAGTTCAININTSDPIGYVIGSATFTGANSMQLNALTFTLVGTSVASAYPTTPIYISASTFNTNRSSVGGSNPIYSSIYIYGSATFTTDTTCTGNLALDSPNSGCGINGGSKISFGGNLSITATGASGTSTLEFIGSNAATWTGAAGGTYQLDVIVNKSSGAVVTAGSALAWGVAGKVLTLNSKVDFATNANTFTINSSTTINNVSGNTEFYNLTIATFFPTTLTISGLILRVTNNLIITGGAMIFAGAFGWDCNNLICSSTGTVTITLQQGITYRTRTSVSITGGVATTLRPTMRSSLANSYAIWTLDFGATQTLIYVNGTDIDSSGGQTIWSFGVIPATHLIRTINWNPGVPLRTVVHTFVT